jgi:hypothetical protein
MKSGDWTTLEVAKLAVGASIPILVAVIGYRLNASVKRLEQAQWASRTLIERRLDLFDKMAGPLNDLLCFFLLFGDFQKITPPDAIRRKRVLDKLFYTNEPLMTEDFAEKYDAFMKACFRTRTGLGRDAKLRASEFDQVAERGERWREEWTACFVSQENQITSPDVVATLYKDLTRSFAADLGVERR